MNSRADIICLCNYHGIGGAQLNAAMLTNAFIDRGFNAQLGFVFEREPLSRHGTEHFFVLADKKPFSIKDWKRLYLAYKTKILDQKPRVIIGFFPLANAVGAFASRQIGDCRVIATQRNPSDKQSFLFGAVDRVIGGLGMYEANIAVSESVRNSFSKYSTEYKRRMLTVYNATPNLAELHEDKAASRKALAISSDNIVLGCLGRLHPQKNLKFAIDVLAEIPGAVLYLAGEGPERAQLQEHAEKRGVAWRVRFLGSLEGADVTRFYRSLDVLLFCSIYEGFGRVLVEAMSQGTPVVASDIEIAKEVGGHAATYRPFDATGWAKAILDLAVEGPIREQAMKNGRHQASKYSLDAMVTGYLAAAKLI